MWCPMEGGDAYDNMKKYSSKYGAKELAERKEELKIAMEMLKKLSADELLREKNAAREKARLDAISSMAYVEERGEKRGEIRGEKKGRAAGKAEGRAEGEAEGKAEVLIRQLSKKIGILSAPLQDKILNASLSELDLLIDEIFDITSIDEVEEIIDKE